MKRWYIAMVMLAVVAGGFPRGAVAQEKADDPVAEFNEGVKLAGEGKWPDSVNIWLGLQGRMPEKHVPTWHLYLGMGNKALKHYPESWHHFTTYLQTSGKEDPATGKDLQEVEEKLVKAGFVKVGITCEPVGSMVSFHPPASSLQPPASTYACPLTWWFKPGKHQAWAVHAGCKAKELELDVLKRGGKAAFPAKLEDCKGTLIIEGNRKATQVFINGSLEGKVPFERKLKAGEYKLMVGPPGEMPWKKTLSIQPGATVVETPALAQKVAAKAPEPDGDGNGTTIVARPEEKKKGAGAEVTKWALFGGGLALVVVGGILNGASYSKNEDLHDKYPPDSAVHKEAYNSAYDDEVKPLSTAAYVLYGVGAAAAAAGGVWVIVDAVKAAPKRATGVSMAPMLGAGTAGAMVGWEF